MKTKKCLILFATLGLLTFTASAQSWLTNGLVAYYPFSGNANDASGNGHDGVLHGALVLVTNTPKGTGFRFNGVDSCISLGTWMNVPSFTIALWVKPDAQVGHAVIMDNNHSGTQNWVLQCITGWSPNIYSWFENGDCQIPSNKWSHVILRAEASGPVATFLDGKLVASDNRLITYGNPPSLSLGAWLPQNARYWRGEMDEVRFYNRALSSNEIAALYAYESSPQVEWTWTKLKDASEVPTDFVPNTASVDYARDLVYSVRQASGQSGQLIVYSIASNSFTTLPAGGWPGEVYEFVFDSTSNRIMAWLAGRGEVSAIPSGGGTWQSLGGGPRTWEDFGNNKWWNPATGTVDTFGGYGGYHYRNWEWEFVPQTGSWNQVAANAPGAAGRPWPRAGFQGMAPDGTGNRLLFFAGEGNSSGNQFQIDPGYTCSTYDRYGNPCSAEALQDVWEFSLTNRQWRNIVSVTNTQPNLMGPIVYIPPLNSLLLVGGRIPPQNYQLNQVPVTNDCFLLDLNHPEAGFVRLATAGTAPTVGPDNGLPVPVYVSGAERILSFSSNGVYALSFNGTATVRAAITAQPQAQIAVPYGTTHFEVAAEGTDPINYQWLKNGLPLAGATNTTLALGNVQIADEGNYSAVVANAGGSVTSSVAPLHVIHAAVISPVLMNGFLIGANIVDPGWGYTNTPAVKIISGDGTGATAVAVVSNGVIVAVNILDAGHDYTSAPVIVTTPPYVPQPVMGIASVTFLSFSNLAVGGTYQLQRFSSWFWLNHLPAFVALESSITQLVAGVAQSGSYRLALDPVPSQAYATAQVVNGFVVGATVTNGGSGYVAAPAVTITGGGGSNATMIAHLSGGSVTGLAVTSAGIGYTYTPTVRIAPPPASAVFPTIIPAMRLDLDRLCAYENYQAEFKATWDGTWTNAGALFSPPSITNTQILNVTGDSGYFQLRHVP